MLRILYKKYVKKNGGNTPFHKDMGSYKKIYQVPVSYKNVRYKNVESLDITAFVERYVLDLHHFYNSIRKEP